MKDHWKNIFGWFDYAEVLDAAVERLNDGDIIVELGTFLGASTCYFAQKIKEKNVKVTYYACDIFEAPKVDHIPEEYWGDFYQKFLENLVKQDVNTIVTPVCRNSLDFADFFNDGAVSFIYIDDNHEVEHVYKEMNLWYPKLRKEGVMAGHDYNAVKDAVIRFCDERGLSYFRTGGSWTLTEGEK